MDVMAKIEAGQYQNAGTAQLNADLEVEHGLSGHPKAVLLWNLALDISGPYNQAEVAYKYATLAELLK